MEMSILKFNKNLEANETPLTEVSLFLGVVGGEM